MTLERTPPRFSFILLFFKNLIGKVGDLQPPPPPPWERHPLTPASVTCAPREGFPWRIRSSTPASVMDLQGTLRGRFSRERPNPQNPTPLDPPRHSLILIIRRSFLLVSLCPGGLRVLGLGLVEGMH